MDLLKIYDTTFGVSDNIIDASYLALIDSIDFKLHADASAKS